MVPGMGGIEAGCQETSASCFAGLFHVFWYLERGAQLCEPVDILPCNTTQMATLKGKGDHEGFKEESN